MTNNTDTTLPIRQITGTSYSLRAQDAGAMLRSLSDSDTTITIPDDSQLAADFGATIAISKIGAGDVTVSAASGVVLQASSTSIATQYDSRLLVKVGKNTWQLT